MERIEYDLLVSKSINVPIMSKVRTSKSTSLNGCSS